MKHLLKAIIERSPLQAPLKKLTQARRQKSEIIEWERSGRPAPPPHAAKQRVIRCFAERFELDILIETGTYYGDMVTAMKDHFNKIYSIELSQELYEKAKKRFERDEKVTIIHGDSGIELGNLVCHIDQPALFWLDGHYSAGITAKGSKDTPIYEELTHIFNTQQNRHVIIIDDARCFGEDPAYPSIEELTGFIRSKRPDANIEIADDSIRITPTSMIG